MATRGPPEVHLQGAHEVQRHLSDSSVFVIELTSPALFPLLSSILLASPGHQLFFQLTTLACVIASTSKAFAHILPTR